MGLFSSLKKAGFFELTERQQVTAINEINKGFDREIKKNNVTLARQDRQIAAIQRAEAKFKAGGNINTLIKFWERIWESGGLVFNGSHWTFRLVDLYIKQKRYDDALLILDKVKPGYAEKVERYRERIVAKIK
jgi:hypothetical protein